MFPSSWLNTQPFLQDQHPYACGSSAASLLVLTFLAFLPELMKIIIMHRTQITTKSKQKTGGMIPTTRMLNSIMFNNV